ncbi:MAG: proline racemase, partial [Bacteroidetes bacterium]
EGPVLRTIEMHTGGEPLRVILGGYPPIPGKNVLERRRYVREHLDHLRRALMHEPRGHADMYGCLIVPPNDPGADFGVLFLHNEGYSTMCGHAVIAMATLAVEMEWVERQEPETRVVMDAPCGRIQAFARVEGGRVASVRFEGVPSFVVELDAEVEVPELGRLRYDLAYGGAFYAYVDAASLGLELTPENYGLLIRRGMQIKRAVMAARPIVHPFEADLGFLYGTIFIGGPVSPGVDSRNVCVFAEGEVDRCPTGSGVMGRLAIHHARKEIGIGDFLRIESILGSVFRGRVLDTVPYGPYPAVIPEVEGQAFITGSAEFHLDARDPFRHGFFLR